MVMASEACLMHWSADIISESIQQACMHDYTWSITDSRTLEHWWPPFAHHICWSGFWINCLTSISLFFTIHLWAKRLELLIPLIPLIFFIAADFVHRQHLSGAVKLSVISIFWFVTTAWQQWQRFVALIWKLLFHYFSAFMHSWNHRHSAHMTLYFCCV